MTQVVQEGDTVLFSYDYNLLLRWLLKMLFNNARAVNAGGEHIKRFRKYIDFMLNDGKPPSDIFVFLQLIRPQIIEGKEIPPFYMVCGRFQVPDLDTRFADIYVICIDSFRFFIAAMNGISSIIRGRVMRAFKQNPEFDGARRLLQMETKTKVEVSSITALRAMGPMMLENIELWEERLKGRK